MTVQEYVRTLGERAKKASRDLRRISTARKNAALEAVACALEAAQDEISAANARDVAAAKAAGLSAALVDRLALTPERFASMVRGVREVASLADPVGRRIWRRKRPSGIVIEKVREPFGVAVVVFESRPNVFVDTAALCLKTSNAIILRGGREAVGSNAALAKAVRAGLLSAGLPEDAVVFVENQDHEAVRELVRMPEYVDIAIPRGGERLIRAITEAALVPVLKHYKGVCHVYACSPCNEDMALRILDNAKVQRPGACNAAETLLVDRRIEKTFMPKVAEWAKRAGVVLHCGEDADFAHEYLALELNVKVVDGLDEAIEHINNFGSHHSDAIVTSSKTAAARFLRDVDSAAVYWNASTRFTDGAEFGMGAEIGISTDKMHARGPMGLEELTSYKYIVRGDAVGGSVRK